MDTRKQSSNRRNSSPQSLLAQQSQVQNATDKAPMQQPNGISLHGRTNNTHRKKNNNGKRSRPAKPRATSPSLKPEVLNLITLRNLPSLGPTLWDTPKPGASAQRANSNALLEKLWFAAPSFDRLRPTGVPSRIRDTTARPTSIPLGQRSRPGELFTRIKSKEGAALKVSRRSSLKRTSFDVSLG